MRIIKDIVVNLKKFPYEVYDWDEKDYIEHIKLIPAFKVNKVTFDNLFQNIIKMDKMFLDKIKNKSKVYFKGMIKNIEYASLFIYDDIVLALEFNKNGIVIGKSRLIYDEEEDVIDKLSKERIEIFNYKIIKKVVYDLDITRLEKKVIFFLDKNLDTLPDNLIKYLYFECFNMETSDSLLARKKIKEVIKNKNMDLINKIMNVIKVIKS